ncbi:DNA-binding response regulator [Sulfurimicrobium lacus]|uniref:DNA-binding response regulator n=1 Tax=Sulfurimicrobium lacus TaxID=2715678 RepID=A0A6F8VC26_9PROT|nr:response regulator [Sulfurimicrobium lacus]BCB26880.1 DNA-binding response regulator [Sulfurimicrobium lacus]
MRLLLVEDDRMIGESVRKGLRQERFAVDWVQDGRAAELLLQSEDFDLLLLDLGLPRKEGLDVLRTLRERNNPIPVLILTARDAVADRVRGLNAGADDYLVKPFDFDELVARIHALLRRQAGRADPLIRYGTLVLNPITHETLLDGRPLTLSARELALLEAFVARPGAVFSVASLQQKMYGLDDDVGSNTVEVYIHALRKKLGPDFIRNVRGVGYMVPKIP